MIARTQTQLIEYYRTTQIKELTIEDLLKLFSEEQINKSTYFNKMGQRLRLMNSDEHTSLVPGLFSYNKDYIINLQKHYSNVSPFSSESATKNINKKLDLLLTSSNKQQDNRVNPSLEELLSNENNS